MWSWEGLSSLAFLPRVSVGRVVLALARWRLTGEELSPLRQEDPTLRFESVQVLRERLALPRYVALQGEENEMLIDLENTLCVDTLAWLLRSMRTATLTEPFPAPDASPVRGPNGRYFNELVIPYSVALPSETPQQRVHAPLMMGGPTDRTPGTEWLYAKLYTGPATADRLLRVVVDQVTKRLKEAGIVDRWFFLRYGDPDFHLRLRLHGEPARLWSEGLCILRDALEVWLTNGGVRRFQLDTYEPEVARYGGSEGLAISEELFWRDSEAVLAVLGVMDGEDALDQRWYLCLVGIDALATDLGLDFEQRLQMFREMRSSYGREHEHFVSAKVGRRILSDAYRSRRSNIEAVLRCATTGDARFEAGQEAIRNCSRAMAPAIARLHDLESAGRLTQPIARLAQSYIHLHVNRLQRGAHWQHELILYDFLAKYYDSRVARSCHG
jgi:thiopeptide-type bacteriocin biosynthesis protein